MHALTGSSSLWLKTSGVKSLGNGMWNCRMDMLRWLTVFESESGTESILEEAEGEERNDDTVLCYVYL